MRRVKTDTASRTRSKDQVDTGRVWSLLPTRDRADHDKNEAAAAFPRQPTGVEGRPHVRNLCLEALEYILQWMYQDKDRDNFIIITQEERHGGEIVWGCERKRGKIYRIICSQSRQAELSDDGEGKST